MRGEKSEHNLTSLGRIWRIDTEQTTKASEELVKSGFFVTVYGDKSIYKIPFIYRPALDIVQGKAEEV